MFEMRHRRLKALEGDAVYHCVTRVVNGEMLLDDEAKEMLRKQLWQAAEFCGVELLTYCLMTNHFHVLVRVPDAQKVQISDPELMRRYRHLYPRPTKYQVARAESLEAVLRAGGSEAEALRHQLHRRMHDVSEFMKTVKQRFSVWYNRSHNRYGTLWAERFKSILIEGTALATRTLAAYIDLNPVRAGQVEDPKDYRWCGYAEALAGQSRARAGLKTLFGSEKNYLASYRQILFGKGATAKKDGQGAIINHKKALKILNEDGGRLPVATVLRCRVRYFTDGAILGSKNYVTAHLKARHTRRETTRQAQPKPLPGANWGELTTARNLRHTAFT